MTAVEPGRLASAQDLRLNGRPGSDRDGELLRQYALSRDPRLRELLVERYLPLARYAANRYARGDEPFDDLLQVACEGLLKAIERFEPSRGHSFPSYALPTMQGELRRYFRDRCWTVRPPRDLQERTLVVERALGEMTTDLGRSPTVGELAERLGLGDEAVLEALQARHGRRAVSLTGPAHDDEDGGADRVDLLGAEESGFRAVEQRFDLGVLSQVLTAREAEAVRLRFEHDLTQEEIGRRIGVSQMQVSRMLRAALDKLRDTADAHP